MVSVLLPAGGPLVTTVAAADVQYPETAVVDQVDVYHGVAVKDPYRWREDVDSPETHAWVQAQNAVTFGFLESIPERGQYQQRLTEIWDYTRYSSPQMEGGRTFFFKNDGLQNQAVLYVQDSADDPPRVLLNPNLLSEDGTVALSGTSITKDGRRLAYATSASGSDWRTWHVRDVATGNDLDDVIEWSKFSGASWNPDGSGFYYSAYAPPSADDAYEEANYFQKLYYHEIGTPQQSDRLVYERPDQKEWGFQGNVSDDGRWLIISVWHGTHSNNRVYYQDLSRPGSAVVRLLDDFDASYNFVGNDGEDFFFATDLDAPRQRIITIDTRHPERAHWRTVIAEQEDTLEGATILDNCFVLTYLRDVCNVVTVHSLDGKHLHNIELPGLGSVSGFGGHADDTSTYFTFTSYLNPSEIYRYDFTTDETTLFRAPQIDFDFSGYETRRVFYSSKDGTRIPLFITCRQDLELDGNNPTILYGYGGFNIALSPRFRTSLLPWLEQGGVYAVANLRGGSEYGEQWHQGGMLANKQNTFDDCIAAAEYLIAEGYTSTPKLAVSGASNGGTLVGAVVNQRPDLFGAALPAVGVMDMLRFQRFTIGWAWVSDYGSSEDPEMFPVLHAYSPYHNLKRGTEYPAVLVTTADHDDRVVPGHSFKYAAALQAAQSGDCPVLIRIQTKAGHGAGKPTAMIIQEAADRYAFLHRVLGM